MARTRREIEKDVEINEKGVIINNVSDSLITYFADRKTGAPRAYVKIAWGKTDEGQPIYGSIIIFNPSGHNGQHGQIINSTSLYNNKVSPNLGYKNVVLGKVSAKHTVFLSCVELDDSGKPVINAAGKTVHKRLGSVRVTSKEFAERYMENQLNNIGETLLPSDKKQAEKKEDDGPSIVNETFSVIDVTKPLPRKSVIPVDREQQADEVVAVVETPIVSQEAEAIPDTPDGELPFF